MSLIIDKDRLVAIVPVRSGSKGLPGKNMRTLDGVPLYLRAVHQGLRTVGRVLLSTDITSVAQHELPANVRLCPRPPALAADDTPMSLVIAHLVESQNLANHTLVLLQATSPLRADSDVTAALLLYAEGRHDLVMSVVERDREILKYGLLANGNFTAVRDPAYCFANRQSLPMVCGPNGAVYVFAANKFIEAGGFPSGRIGAIEMAADRSEDIDTAEDFKRVEDRIVRERLLIEKRGAGE